MKRYLNQRAAIQVCGVPPRRNYLPKPTVVIGNALGWDQEILAAFKAGKPVVVSEPVRHANLTDIVVRLRLSKRSIMALRDSGTFPDPVAYIGPLILDDDLRGVFGWDLVAVVDWAKQTGRLTCEGLIPPNRRRGRPVGSGNYTDLPRCGRPKTVSVNGRGKPCRAVCRKVDGRWAPACGIHLTARERHTLGLSSPT